MRLWWANDEAKQAPRAKWLNEYTLQYTGTLEELPEILPRKKWEKVLKDATFTLVRKE
jgi:hypothetical protein